MPEELAAATAAPPPNWLKSAVTLAKVSVLPSPAVLAAFQVAVMVSPTIKAPPVPLPPLTLILASVMTGATLSTVALLVSAVVVLLPALSVAVTDTLRFVPSMAPATMV